MTAVVFDLGGVLLRWQPLDLLQQCVPELAGSEDSARTLAAQVFESFTPDSDWAHFDLGLVAEDELALRIGARIGTSAAQVRRIIDAIPGHLTAKDDTVSLMAALEQAGHRLYFLSNMPQPYADRLEQANAFMAGFADGIFSGRVGLMKPHAAIFELAERRFGLDPTRTVFIDDHAGNIEVARGRGWQGLTFTAADAAERVLQARGWL